MKFLLLGKNGQVGWELHRTLSPLAEIVAPDRSQLDLSAGDQLRRYVNKVNADVIINAAAYTAVDKAETELDLADSINHFAPKILAREASNSGALLIHYSTDYVFDGSKRKPYSELDRTCPVNVYGSSKLAGEEAIQEAGCDTLIFRTAWVYASRGNNFLLTIRRLAQERQELNVVADQIGTPTWARLIAEVSAHCIRQALLEKKQQDFASGIFNLTAKGESSWHGFAQAIIANMRRQGVKNLSLQKMNAITSNEYPTPAQRPMYSRMNNERLEKRFNLIMPEWEQMLELCMEQMT